MGVLKRITNLQENTATGRKFSSNDFAKLSLMT